MRFRWKRKSAMAARSVRLGAAGVSLILSAMLGGCVTVTSTLPDGSGVVSDEPVGNGDATASVVEEHPVESAEDARERAQKALAEGDVDLALYMYLQAVDLEPQDSESLYRIGVIHQKKGNKSLAASAYARAIEIDPQHAPALQELGLLYFEAKKTEAAQSMLERAVAADPQLWRAHDMLGVIADTRGDYEMATGQYDAALAVRPGTASILNNRGYSRYLAGDYDTAEEDYRAAIAADAEYERAWRNLGLLYARQRKYGFALRAMSHVMGRHVAANDVGYVAMLDGDYDAAETLFAEAMRLSPRYYKTAQENAAELHRRRGASADAAAKPRERLE
jgi:Flp pilus assembly protein TadD